MHEFKPMVDHLIGNGIDSMLVSGTTGEQHSMTIDERLQMIDYFNEQNFQEVELIFGVSATRTSDAVRLVKALENSVFDVILIGFPPYIRPTQEQAVSYIEALLTHRNERHV
ncbi:dihydrodipicolinate synthase family protein [Salicibibacter kimchii]|uniref:dihydrodipicolinate synthase family protein n=1 Tax=Salicibibacter kimchii TaxID=2099786 RepID=UPI0026C03AE9